MPECKKTHCSIGKSTGVLSTKTVTETVTVAVAATPQDGFGEALVLTVTVHPATKSIALKDGENTVTGKTLSKVVSEEPFRLEAVSDPVEAAGRYNWKSSSSSYVSVDEEGYVTVKKTGRTVTITCTAADGSGKTATVRIKGVAAE